MIAGMGALGTYIKRRRTELAKQHAGFSIRGLAKRVGIHHSYLSKLERGENAPLTPERVAIIARELGEDEELLAALGGRLSERVARMLADAPERFHEFVLDLERGTAKPSAKDGYVQRLEQRKKDLEILAHALREEIEERRALERRLRREEAERRLILDNLDGVVVKYIDRDLNIIWCSESLLADMGAGVHNVQGRKCFSVMHRRSEVCPNCRVIEVFKSGATVVHRINTASGKTLLVRNAPIKNALGEVERVVQVGVDVTELVETKTKLSDSEARWRFALEGAGDGVWDWDAQSGRTYFSPRLEEMLGYAPGEFGDHVSAWESRIHPDDHQRVMREIGKLRDGEIEVYESEHRVRCKDGAYKWILDRGKVMERTPDGAPKRVVGTHADVDPRKAAEDLLQAEKTFFNALCAGIQDGVCVVDVDFTLRFVNPMIEDWVGKGPIKGRKCFEAFHGRANVCPDCPGARTLATGLPGAKMSRFSAPDGVRRLDVRTYPLQGEDGRTTGFVEVIRDVTLPPAVDVTREYFTAVIENSPNVVVVKDRDLKVVAANARFAQVLGKSGVKELLGKTDAELFGISADEEPVKSFVNDDVAALKLPRGEWIERTVKMKTPEGGVRFARLRKFPVTGPDGEAFATATVSVDVTERELARREIEAAKSRLTELFDKAPMGLSQVAPDGRITFMNDRHARLHGYDSAEDMLLRAPNDLDSWIDPADWRRMEAAVERLGSLAGFESRARRRDGSSFWTSRTVRALREQGRVVALEMFTEDVTARKEAEFVSEASRRRLLAVLELLMAGVAVIDVRTNGVLFVNAYFSQRLGEDLVGEPASRLTADPSLPFPPPGAGETCAGEDEPESVEVRFADGRRRLCSFRPIHWGHGPGLLLGGPALLVTAVDVEDMRRAEAMREEVQKIMQHDLKSPLNGIINLPGILAETEILSEEGKEIAGVIADSGRRMLALINASLTLHRIERGAFVAGPAVLNAEKEIRSALSQLESTALQRSITVTQRTETPTDDGGFSFLGDAALMPSIFGNIIKNALEAAPRRSEVSILLRRTRPGELAGPGVAVEVHNEGEIPQDLVGRFFEKYATSGKEGGTGLGAYSARTAARALDGDVRLASVPGEGVTVVILLTAP